MGNEKNKRSAWWVVVLSIVFLPLFLLYWLKRVGLIEWLLTIGITASTAIYGYITYTKNIALTQIAFWVIPTWAIFLTAGLAIIILGLIITLKASRARTIK